MSLSVWYWLFMALWLLSGLWGHWQSPVAGQPPYLVWGNSLLTFLLFLILGIAVLGGPIK